MSYCQNCKNVYPDENQFCPYCGAPQPNPQTYAQQAPRQYVVAPQAWYQCRNCNAMIPISPQAPVSVCPVCRKPLTGTKEQSMWTPGRLVMQISILLTFAGTFLPYLTYGILGVRYNINLWSENFRTSAYLVAVLLGISFLITTFLEKSKGTVAELSAVTILIDLYLNYTSNQKRLTGIDTGFGEMDLSGLLSPGVGFYLMAIGCAGMLIAGFMMHHSSKGK